MEHSMVVPTDNGLGPGIGASTHPCVVGLTLITPIGARDIIFPHFILSLSTILTCCESHES